MPNKPAATKALRQSIKRAKTNLRMKTHFKQTYKKAVELKKGSDDQAKKTAFAKFQQIADKAAKKNVISKALANRKKSVLMKSK